MLAVPGWGGYWEIDCDDVEGEDSEDSASVDEGEVEITVEVNQEDAYNTEPDDDNNATPILSQMIITMLHLF